jgi:hypothetical protein
MARSFRTKPILWLDQGCSNCQLFWQRLIRRFLTVLAGCDSTADPKSKGKKIA